MNAVIDIGNTQAKIGLFEDETKLEVSVISLSKVVPFLEQINLAKALVSNVSANNELITEIEKAVGQLEVLSIDTPMPIKTSYETPGTLGVDRLAACVGALSFTKGNMLVIDAGTCITLDLITNNNHIGGMISPGVEMRMKAMHTFTANLPLVSLKKVPIVGTTTEKCLQSGATNGALAEIKSLILEFQKKYEDLSIIIGGGDAVFFDKNLELSTFVVPNLAVEGLYAIFKYNE